MTTALKPAIGLHHYDVSVAVSLIPLATAQDAEIDPSDVRTHTFEVDAASKHKAEETALDEFHSTIAIGVLDYVKIKANAVRR